MNSREFVVEVIELYRSLTCLWNVSDSDYHDRDKRAKAMDQLLLLFKKKDLNATKEMVKKKISSMRSAYKKELNKVKASMRSGAGADEIHTPKLWYFEMLSFLDDQSVPRASQNIESIFDRMPFGSDEDCEEDFIESTSRATSASSKASMLEGTSKGQSTSSLKRPRSKDCEADFTESTSRAAMLEGQRRPRSKAGLAIEKISKRMDQLLEKRETEAKPYTHFGAHVVEKLRTMEPLMAIYCQKVINEALFHGDLGHLTMNSTVIQSISIDSTVMSNSKDANTS